MWGHLVRTWTSESSTGMLLLHLLVHHHLLLHLEVVTHLRTWSTNIHALHLVHHWVHLHVHLILLRLLHHWILLAHHHLLLMHASRRASVHLLLMIVWWLAVSSLIHLRLHELPLVWMSILHWLLHLLLVLMLPLLRLIIIQPISECIGVKFILVQI